MSEKLRALAVLPHPDDETVFMGGTLAKLSSQGVETSLLVLTSGGQGKASVMRGETIVGFRETENGEKQEFQKQREQECLEAANVLGIQKVEFLRIPDQGVDERHFQQVKEKIQNINPHIVLTFNEAGTTAHPDHSWTALLTFYAIESLLSEQAVNDLTEQMNFLSLMMYTLPSAVQWFEKHGEVVRPSNVITVDVSKEMPLKKQAAVLHKTQTHLIQFFQKQGLLDVSEEYFIEGISKNGDTIRIDEMPKSDSSYIGSYVGLLNEIEERCQRIEKVMESLRKEHITTLE